MEALSSDKEREKDFKEFSSKLNNDAYTIKIGPLNEYLIIKAINESNIKNKYISYFTYDEIKNISKSMRYFDNIKDIIAFMEEKGKKNEIFMKKEKDIL